MKCPIINEDGTNSWLIGRYWGWWIDEIFKYLDKSGKICLNWIELFENFLNSDFIIGRWKIVVRVLWVFRFFFDWMKNLSCPNILDNFLKRLTKGILFGIKFWIQEKFSIWLMWKFSLVLSEINFVFIFVGSIFLI